ncbi:HAMP domain-containing sensor histidine kinase [Clostridium sp.]|uniref:sensor histidine kinase n=1 Tax=Clostridium sp. TaxID=1506 RepID=UPI003F4C3E43
MMKWILNKGLRFQLTLVLFLALSVPTAVLVWNVSLPSNMSDAVRSMQEDKSRNFLEYIDETIDKEQISNLNNTESVISSSLKPLSRTVRDTRIGIYVATSKKRYTYGKMVDRRHDRLNEEINYEDIEKGIDASLKKVIERKADGVDYIEVDGREIQRYFHPIALNDKVIAVAWSDNFLPPELNTNKKILISLMFIFPLGLVISLLLLLAIIKNQSNSIKKIKDGLEAMPGDLSSRIGDMGGDIGKVVDSINIMAETLQKKEKIEENLARSEKLASLGHLISGVAHEIRNPLGIIRGTVQLMERDFKGDERLTEYVRIVKEQSDRESKVIQELLDYARPSKQILMNMDINVLIRSVLSFTNKYIQENHVCLKTEYGEKIPLVNIDCDKIKQVFVNIIINACEAMEDGGALTIRTRGESGFIVCIFCDTGAGMDETQMKNIFDPYYTTKSKGTGLGLSISNGIIELHGGNIEVHSKKDEGSEFIIKLPCV